MKVFGANMGKSLYEDIPGVELLNVGSYDYVPQPEECPLCLEVKRLYYSDDSHSNPLVENPPKACSTCLATLKIETVEIYTEDH